MKSNEAPRLRADAISVGYGAHIVLHDVSIEVWPGQLVVVLGPNGAGKSSLLRALSGTLTLSSGRVLLNEINIASLDRRSIAQRVAVVPQRTDVAMGFRVRDVVAMGRAPHQGALLIPSADDLAAIDAAIERTSLSQLADRPVEELSGGEQQRVAIARALCQATPTLLLDEPGAHLDLRHAHALHELLRSEVSARALACVMIAHDLNMAAQYADRVVLLDAGRVLADGPADEVMTEQRLGALFDVALHVGHTPGGHRSFVPLRDR